MYRNQALINLMRDLCQDCLNRAHRLKTDEARAFMKRVVAEMRVLSQLKVEKTARIERITHNERDFRSRYIKVLLDTLDYYQGMYRANFRIPRPEAKRVYRQFWHMRNKIKTYDKYKSENL